MVSCVPGHEGGHVIPDEPIRETREPDLSNSFRDTHLRPKLGPSVSFPRHFLLELGKEPFLSLGFCKNL